MCWEELWEFEEKKWGEWKEKMVDEDAFCYGFGWDVVEYM